MDQILQSLFEILTSPPGYLVYHIILMISLMVTIQVSLTGGRTAPRLLRRRMVIGLAAVLLIQFVLFIASGTAWQGVVDAHIVLPPLDRAFTAFSLLALLWLWIFPQPNKWGDFISGALGLFVIAILAFNLALWPASSADTFNHSIFDWTWQGFCLVILITSMILLPVFRPTGWETGIAFVILNLGGVVVHLLWNSASGDFAAPLRIAQLCSFPLLPGLAQRLVNSQVQPLPAAAVVQSLPAPVEKRLYSADARTVDAWLQFITQQEPIDLVPSLAHAAARTMLADLCYILSIPNAQGEIIVQGGYDLIRESELPGALLHQGNVPVIANALLRGRPIRLGLGTSPSPDLAALVGALDLEKSGSVLLVPLATDQLTWGGILFLSPYSNRVWSSEDQTYLQNSIPDIVTVLTRSALQVKHHNEEEHLTQELQSSLEEIELLHKELLKSSEEIKRLDQALQAAVNAPPALVFEDRTEATPDMAVLPALDQGFLERIAILEAENQRLQNETTRKTATTQQTNDEMGHIESELRLTLEEVARLQNSLADSNIKIMNLQQQINQAGYISNEDREVVASITQELRQPMASIVGYTDLLLSESVGILGALQRKFMERIKASIERMKSLLDDLIQITALQSGNIDLIPQQVDLNAIIDQTVAETSSQLREKKISLRIDLPDELPALQADRDALQQILVHLLQNAGAVTPLDGTISLKASVEEDKEHSYLLIQIADTGGGIAPTDLPKVFARRYRADNPLIQGIGDSGVGLSIAKTLAEAQGGRIWVESEAGQTTTFSVLIPIHAEKKASPESI